MRDINEILIADYMLKYYVININTDDFILGDELNHVLLYDFKGNSVCYKPYNDI